jgi:hypothetical protein
VALHKIAQDHVGPEWPRTDQVGPDPASVVEELSAPKLIAFHLIPGALVTVAFVPFAPLVQAAGLPGPAPADGREPARTRGLERVGRSGPLTLPGLMQRAGRRTFRATYWVSG